MAHMFNKPELSENVKQSKAKENRESGERKKRDRGKKGEVVEGESLLSAAEGSGGRDSVKLGFA